MRRITSSTLLICALITGLPMVTSGVEPAAWEAELAADPVETKESGSGLILELASVGAGAGLLAANRYILPPERVIDLTDFEQPLSAENLQRLRSYVNDRMARYNTQGVRNPFVRLYRYLNGPVAIVNADSRIISSQGPIHNYGLMQSSPEVYGDIKAKEKSLFTRKIPFIGKLEPTGVAPAFKDYVLDARARGGAPTVVACLDRIGSCQALTRSFSETTNGRLLARRFAKGGGYLAIFLPVILNADELFMVFFVDEASEVECMTNYENCGFEWFRNLKRAVSLD